MSLLEKYKKLPLIKKILLLISIPIISYSVVTFNQLKIQFDGLKQAETMLSNNSFNLHVSDAIKDIQVERGRSVVYLKSKEPSDLEALENQRKKVDEKLLEVSSQIESHLDWVSDKTVLNIPLELKKLKELRAKVNSHESTTSIVKEYTHIVHLLIKLIKSSSLISTAEIGSRVVGTVILEAARENAGLLRANLISVIAEDLPIDEDKVFKLVKFHSKIQGNLSSDALDISEKNLIETKKMEEKPHWVDIDRIFRTVIQLANEGGFGEDKVETFEKSTLVVNDITGIIHSENKDLASSILEIKEDVYSRVKIVLVGVLLNIFLIISTLLYSARQLKEQLFEMSESLYQTNNTISATSSELAKTSQNLSSGSEQTAASIQETVSSMAEMNSMVNLTLQKSQSTTDTSEMIRTKVQKTNETMENMVDSMNELAKSNEQLDEVNKIIKSISKQTKVINDIVFKTQLLAVNASIEAAKAGNQGKGFAVVAEEVSKLAQMSGDASEKISDLLDESEDKVTHIIEEVGVRVSRGSETSHSVQTAFTEITEDVDNIKTLAEDMTKACEEQNLGMDQISSAIAEIDSATQSNTREAQDVEQKAKKLENQRQTLEVFSSDLNRKLIGVDAGKSQNYSIHVNSDSIGYSNEKSLELEHGNNSEYSATNIDDDDDDDANLADDDSFRPVS